MGKFFLGVFMTLLLGGGIIFLGDSLGSILYNVLYYGTFIAVIVCIIYMTLKLINILGIDGFPGDESKMTKVGYLILLIGVSILILSVTYFISDKVKNNYKSFVNDIVSRIKFEEGKIPVIYIGNDFE